MRNPIIRKKTRCRLQASNGSKQISFLPEPDFNLILPSKNTLAYRALSMMLQGKKISHPNFQDETSSWRLAAHIHVLKKLGWPVQTIEVIHNAAVKPKSRHICRYFLSHNVIEKFKRNGGAL